MPSRTPRLDAADRPLLFAGLAFLAIGAATLLACRAYPRGTASDMGPGYFPVLLATVLCGLGVAAVIRALRAGQGVFVGPLPLQAALSVCAGVAGFGLVAPQGGLAAAAAVLFACIGHRQLRQRPIEFLLLAAALTAAAALLFVDLLGIPLRLWPQLQP